CLDEDGKLLVGQPAIPAQEICAIVGQRNQNNVQHSLEDAPFVSEISNRVDERNSAGLLVGLMNPNLRQVYSEHDNGDAEAGHQADGGSALEPSQRQCKPARDDSKGITSQDRSPFCDAQRTKPL